MPKATFDKSRLLELHARIGETGVPIILTFVNEDGSAHPITDYDFMLVVLKRPTSIVSMFELEIGTGLTVIGAEENKLKIELSETNSEQEKDTNFYKLIAVEEDHTWLNGPFKFHNGEYDGVDITDDIVVAENGSDITITISSEEGEVISAASQSEVNTGTATGVYVSPSTLQDKDDTAVALVDGATIDLTGPKHTLSTSTGRTFTISHAGDVGTIDITLLATSATFTFPATALCIYAGTASGNNTLIVTGATSGDHIMVGWIKQGADYRVTGVNFGQ